MLKISLAVLTTQNTSRKDEVWSWKFKQSSINGADTVKRPKSNEILCYPKGRNFACKLRPSV